MNFEANEIIKTIQVNELKLIEYIDNILTSNDIWYSLAYGSVLGAVRHGGFIPWDDDIDIIINLHDVLRVRNLLLTDLHDDMHLISYDSDSTSSHDTLYWNDGKSHVDIYPLIGTPNSINYRKYFIKKCQLINRIFRCKRAPINRVRGKLRKILFIIVRGCLMLVPDKLIRRIYHSLEKRYDINKSDYLCILGSDGNIGECINKELLAKVVRVPFEHLDLPIPVNYDSYLSGIYGTNYMKPVIRKSNYVK